MLYKIKLYWQLKDNELENIYETAANEAVLKHLAFDVSMNKNLFMIFARKVDVFGAVYDNTHKAMGFFYLDSFEGSSARIHFCLFKAGRQDRHKMGSQILEWCFETFEFKSIQGIIPAINSGAINYALELGGKLSTFIPGCCWINRLKRSCSGAHFIFCQSKWKKINLLSLSAQAAA